MTVRNSGPSPGTAQVAPWARAVTADDAIARKARNFTDAPLYLRSIESYYANCMALVEIYTIVTCYQKEIQKTCSYKHSYL